MNEQPTGKISSQTIQLAQLQDQCAMILAVFGDDLVIATALLVDTWMGRAKSRGCDQATVHAEIKKAVDRIQQLLFDRE